MRVRPGLPWPALDHLSAGDAAQPCGRLVPDSFRRRAARLDSCRRPRNRRVALVVRAGVHLGRMARRSIRVMGRSADGAEVRLPLIEEVGGWSGSVSAPIDPAGCRPRDLPIGDEVEWSGKAGSAKANEWMWPVGLAAGAATRTSGCGRRRTYWSSRRDHPGRQSSRRMVSFWPSRPAAILSAGKTRIILPLDGTELRERIRSRCLVWNGSGSAE